MPKLILEDEEELIDDISSHKPLEVYHNDKECPDEWATLLRFSVDEY